MICPFTSELMNRLNNNTLQVIPFLCFNWEKEKKFGDFRWFGGFEASVSSLLQESIGLFAVSKGVKFCMIPSH